MVRRIKITLPATLTNIGPALGGLAIAISLHTTLEFSERSDNQLILETFGSTQNPYTDLEHPAVLAAMRVFQKMERAPSGFNLRIENHIPVDSGLGAEAAFAAAGVLGANNLLDANLPRNDLLALASCLNDEVDGVVAAVMGGMTGGILQNQTVIYRNLPVAPMDLVIVTPKIRRYAKRADRAMSKTVDYLDARENLSRVPLLIHALDRGDYDILRHLMEDRLLTPALGKYLKAYESVQKAAQRARAAAVSISGNGPSLVAFARDNHQAIADAMGSAFKHEKIESQAWVLPIDRQGVVMSMTQSAR